MMTLSNLFSSDALSNVLGCATCFGVSGDSSMNAASFAILTMVLLLMPMLGGFLLFIRNLKKREAAMLARQAAEAHGTNMAAT